MEISFEVIERFGISIFDIVICLIFVIWNLEFNDIRNSQSET